jgi:Protein of unknown function (DUF3892)
MPTVTRVRRELSSDRTHHHLEGVCTTAGTHYTRKEVVDGINRGEDWHTSAENKTAKIKPMTHCPRANCYATPYITTAPDHTTENNLENLPEC